ncbi:13173_t:CDS:2 [Gigaspora rosea]|nr:13173_t:CDS:2 [Gigaspora rosea]
MVNLNSEIPKVRCDCGNVLQQRISRSSNNPNRPYYRCADCKYFEWEDENAELNRVLRNPKSLIPASREMPNLITNQRVPQSSANRHFINMDDNFMNMDDNFMNMHDNGFQQESRAPHIPSSSLITSQKASTPFITTSQKASTPFITTSQRAPQNPVNEHFPTNFGGTIIIQTPANKNFDKQEQRIKAKIQETAFLRGQMEKFKKDNEFLGKERVELLKKIESLEKENLELKKKEKVGLKNKGKAVDTGQQRSNNNELDSKVSDLNIKIADLNGKNEQLIQINENLTSKLVSETSRLNQIIGSLQKDNSNLKEQLENRETRETSSSHIGTASNDEYRKILKENSELKSGAQLEKLSALVDQYVKINNELNNENSVLVEENQKLKKENNDLNSIIKGNDRTGGYF